MTNARSTLSGLALAILPALVAAPALDAQSLKSVRTTDFSAAAGVAFPQGSWSDGMNTGFSLAGAVNFRPVNTPVGFRVEALYTRFGADSFTLDGDFGSLRGSGRMSVLAGTGNVVLPIPTASTVRPYLIGGLGLYHVTGTVKLSIDCAVCEGAGNGVSSVSRSQNKLGLNGGAGLEFRVGTLRSFAEARFHSVFAEGSNANFIPVTVGVRF